MTERIDRDYLSFLWRRFEEAPEGTTWDDMVEAEIRAITRRMHGLESSLFDFVRIAEAGRVPEKGMIARAIELIRQGPSI